MREREEPDLFIAVLSMPGEVVMIYDMMYGLTLALSPSTERLKALTLSILSGHSSGMKLRQQSSRNALSALALSVLSRVEEVLFPD